MFPILLILLFTSLPLFTPSSAIRTFPPPDEYLSDTDNNNFHFTESPNYRNHPTCHPHSDKIHVAMTLDSEYLRGSIAAVHSVLRHTSCPDNIFFHFISAEFDPTSPRVLTRLVRNTFTSLSFKVYIFREDNVINLISSSIRVALENPLNYARNYLGDILDPSVGRVIYLDSDVVLVDDINKLWNITLRKDRVIGAPEYCHANFTNYFTENFWSDPDLTRALKPVSEIKGYRQSEPGLNGGPRSELKRYYESGSNGAGLLKRSQRARGRGRPCYFNTGVMVMDLRKWREGEYRKKIEGWMEVQRKKRIYELGSLPPFLLVFGGNIEPIDHRWNQHGLGGDNVKGSCRLLHSGPVSLLHWSGKGKPWVRYDEKRPCPLDHVWKVYDLYRSGDGGGSGSQSQALDYFQLVLGF